MACTSAEEVQTEASSVEKAMCDKDAAAAENRSLKCERSAPWNCKIAKWRRLVDEIVDLVHTTKDYWNAKGESIFGAKVEGYGHRDKFKIRCRRCKARHD